MPTQKYRRIGRYLAHVKLYKVVSELVRKYDFELVNPDRLWKEELKLFLYKSEMMVKIRRREPE